ncbi:hypothetical protein [Burkholderia gladioli]|uniref:hypothetical protein n=1 Tax=Burkholderia gladioli TaxID=28095 RepID=UPI001D110D37|nr:hypothetical protein [Burkholderia gladioli]
MNLTIIGSGYVGLVTGACLADIGHDVFCLDVDPVKIGVLNDGGVPIHEPGLAEIIARNRAAGACASRPTWPRRWRTATCSSSRWHPARRGRSADLQYVLAAARNIGKYMTSFKVIVDKSTVPVGTAERVRATVAAELARAASTPCSRWSRTPSS